MCVDSICDCSYVWLDVLPVYVLFFLYVVRMRVSSAKMSLIR